MAKEQSKGLRFFIYAVLVHLVLFAIIGIGFQFTKEVKVSPAATPIVNAVAVDKRQIEQKQRQADARQQREEHERIRKEQQRKEQEKERQALEKKRADEQSKKAEQERRQRQETERKAEVERERKKAEARERKETEARQRKEAEERERKAAEQRQREEAEARQRKEEEARRKALQDELAAEEAETQRQANEAARNSYITQIGSKLAQVFNKSGFQSGLACTVRVRMVPGGEVVSVKVLRSSGNALFDRQAEVAVQKASPLPVPSNAALFNADFREVDLVFNPWE